MPKEINKIARESSSGASPCCVMQQQQEQQHKHPDQSSPNVRSLSPIALQERYDRHILYKAKLLVIKSNYKEALRVGNNFLREHLKEGWSGPLSYFQTTIQLSTPLIIPETVAAALTESSSICLQVRLGTQLTAVDEMATLVLQCWHELMKKDTNGGALSREAWMHLQPILEIYSVHPMPIQLFTEIWIRFWYASFDFGPALTLAWGLQVAVLLVEYCRRNTATPMLLQELRDELLEFLFTQQLPKLSSCTLTKQIALAILTPAPWEPLIPQIQNHLESQDNAVSLRILRSLLQQQLTSDTCLVPASQLERLLRHRCFQNLPMYETPTLEGAVEGRPLLMIRGMHLPVALTGRLKALLPTSIQALLDRLWQHTTSLLSFDLNEPSNSTAVQQRKMHIAFSVVGILLAWRHRGLVGRWSKALSLALLSPVMEVVDALRTDDDSRM